jgi:hypothetical protein
VARRKRFPTLTGDQAIAVLKWLVVRGELRVGQITDALARRERLVREIRQRLQVLDSEPRGLVQSPEGVRRSGPRRRAGRKVSPAQQAAWRAQGRYLAAVRRLPKGARARIRALRKKSGVRAAIAAAKRITNV